MSRTIALNNQAVRLIRQKGDLTEASELLREALEGMRDVSEGSPPAKEEVPTMTFSEVAGISQQENDESIYMQTGGIMLVGLFVYSPDPLCNISIVSSIILYNLALINQLQGLHGASSNDSCHARNNFTERAASLYARARWILSRIGVTGANSTGLATLDYLSFAIGNNEAYTLYTQGHYPDCRHSLNRMEALAASFRSLRPTWDKETIMLMDKAVRSFLLNTMFLREPLLAPSA